MILSGSAVHLKGLFGVVFDGEAVMAACKSTTDTNTPTLQSPLGELCEEAFHGVQPRAGCRRKVEGEALVPIEPSAHPGMLVGSVIVEDRMDGFAGRSRRLDGVEEADELLMPMALHVAADHRASLPRDCRTPHPIGGVPVCCLRPSSLPIS